MLKDIILEGQDVEEPFNHVTQRGGKTWYVILNECYYKCWAFQAYRYPCYYIIAMCAHVHISPYVDNMYKIENIIEANLGNWNPLGYEKTILEKNGPIIVPEESKIRDKGWPKSSRIKNERDWIKSQHTQTCSQCKLKFNFLSFTTPKC